MRDERSKRSDWIDAVLAQHERPLIRYALHLTGSLEMARDAVQETFLRLCSQSSAKVQDHIGPWLFAVCRTRALDALRRLKHLGGANLDEEQAGGDQPSGASNPMEIAEQNEAIAQALQILATLSPNQQEVIRLRFEDGFSYQEISEVTGLSVTNVGFLIHSGLKTIRHRLQQQQETPMLRRVK